MDITYSPQVLEFFWNLEKNKTAPLAKEKRSQMHYSILDIIFPFLLIGGMYTLLI